MVRVFPLFALATIVPRRRPANPSIYCPPAKRLRLIDCEKLEQTCPYGDLVKICPVGSSTMANPPWPCRLKLLTRVASLHKNTSISLLFFANDETSKGLVK